MHLPPIGLGTTGIDDPDRIATVLDVGYRHLDTARIHENEAVAGKGLAASEITREVDAVVEIAERRDATPEAVSLAWVRL